MRNRDTILLEQAYSQTRRIISEQSKEDSKQALDDAIAAHAKNPNDATTKKNLDDAMTAYYKTVSGSSNTPSSTNVSTGPSKDENGWQLDSTERQVIHDPNTQTVATGATSEIENQTAKDENGNELSYQRTQTPVVAGDDEFKNYKPTAVRPTEVGEAPAPAQKTAAYADAREKLKKQRAEELYQQLKQAQQGN